MSHDSPAGAPAPRTPAGRVIGTALGLSLVLTLIVLAFSWPSVAGEPQDLPVAITGPSETVEEVRDQLTEASPGLLDLVEVDDRQAAVEAIERREVYGGLVLGDAAAGEAPEVLTSSAANGATHQLLNQLAQRLQAQLTERATAAMSEGLAKAQEGAAQASQEVTRASVEAAVGAALRAAGQGAPPQEAAAAGGEAAAAAAREAAEAARESGAAGPPELAIPEVTVTDVVPLSDDDARGARFTAALFPLLLGGMIGGIGISLAVRGALRRVLGVALYSAVGGAILVGVMQYWFGALQGDWSWNYAAMALSIAAIAAPITGFVAIFGRAGIAAGPVLMLLIGNPISGATLPREFLPWHWGEIGQWFPPGASGTLLRDLSYFPAADATSAWIALGAWTLGGVALSLIGAVATARPRAGRSSR